MRRRNGNPEQLAEDRLKCIRVGLIAASVVVVSLRADSAPPWRFAVSGDSRNCGDIVMPYIARGVKADGARFYWHLGDFRAIYTFDDDIRDAHPGGMDIATYLGSAWNDFIKNQIALFQPIPVFLGIGNHELIPPKDRNQYLIQFGDWIDSKELQEQRLRDAPDDHALKTYYHWVRDGIDFVNLDNGSADQFDAAQLAWLRGLIERDGSDANIRALVLGMHEALPDSIADAHSMSQSANGIASGRSVYQMLLGFKNTSSKPVYVLASHSHFYMKGIFNTEYCRKHGGVLPGWIIGTAGAVRYALPATAGDALEAKTHVYGYLLATVSGNRADPVQFEFKEVKEEDMPAEQMAHLTATYTAAGVHGCFVNNPTPTAAQ